jgi:hypothetical protein
MGSDHESQPWHYRRLSAHLNVLSIILSFNLSITPITPPSMPSPEVGDRLANCIEHHRRLRQTMLGVPATFRISAVCHDTASEARRDAKR